MVVEVVLICFAPLTRRRRPLYNIIIIIMYRFPTALYHPWWWVVGRRSSSGIRAEIHPWYSIAADADYDVFVAMEEENSAAVRHHLPSCPGVVSCHTTFSRSFISRPAAAPNAMRYHNTVAPPLHRYRRPPPSTTTTATATDYDSATSDGH